MVEFIIGFIIAAVFTLPFTMIWFNENHSKSPFKNMWLFFDDSGYTFVGKIILCVLTTIFGSPCAIIYGVIWLVFWVISGIVWCFNKMFKKKVKKNG